MSVVTLEIAMPGMFTTLQDTGRYGHQRSGVPVSGAMDEFALRAANLLVGNDESAAGLEMTVVGPQIKFSAETAIAVTGADLSATLNGEPAPRWEAVAVPAGGVLEFGEMKDGMRAYLAVAGGLDVPVVMGSRSTYAKAGLGGLEGRPLARGDSISTLPFRTGHEPVRKSLPEGYDPPTYGEHHRMRVVLGPHDEAFTPEALEALLGSEYTVSLDSDRMGYRLEGPALKHREGPDIVSDANPSGAIQVPGDGMPTVLLADRGTTGGYAKIATVIGADLARLAQAVPGQTVAFQAVSVGEAHQALAEIEAILKDIRDQPGTALWPVPRIRVLVDGEPFEVTDEAGDVVSETEDLGDAARISSRRARASVGSETFEFEVEVQREA